MLNKLGYHQIALSSKNQPMSIFSIAQGLFRAHSASVGVLARPVGLAVCDKAAARCCTARHCQRSCRRTPSTNLRKGSLNSPLTKSFAARLPQCFGAETHHNLLDVVCRAPSSG